MIQQYLALGDSYTIGEGVALFHSFPYQLTQALRTNGIAVSAPEVIAKTGFTTHELLTQLETTRLLDNYELVTILIGVNDQYRGLGLEQFKLAFERILDIATGLTGNQNQRVHILSIPDYGNSPFAAFHDRNRIRTEINRFNEIQSLICSERNLSFIDITNTTDTDLSKPDLYVEDGLHPAPVEYGRWVELLMRNIHLKID